MNVALCLSGQLRKFKTCFPYIKANIIDLYKPDIFICTDPSINYNASVNSDINDGTFEEMLQLYQPKEYKYENENTDIYNDNDLITRQKSESCNLHRFFNDLHRRYIVGTLISQKKYDVVIRSRFDLKINQNIQININNNITIPNCCDWLGGINDQLAWGEYESMKWYFDLFKYVKDYAKNGILIHPETMLLHHLNIKNINITRVQLDYIISR